MPAASRAKTRRVGQPYPTAYIWRPASDFWSQKKATSQSDYSPIHAMVTLLYQMLQSTLRYYTVMWLRWVRLQAATLYLKLQLNRCR